MTWVELKKYKKNFAIEDKNIRPLPDPTEILELTAAQKDSVEENLQKLSSSLNDKNQKAKPVDICLSSSVIEVGVDITRISLLSIVSAPKSVSNIFKVVSWKRLAQRKSALLVIYILLQNQDRSLYEQFRSYHEQLYSWVEPMVTPFCEPVLGNLSFSTICLCKTNIFIRKCNNNLFCNYE